MLPVLHLGPLAVQVPPLILLVSVWLALTVLERNAASLGLKPGPVSNLALTGLAGSVVGARLGHIILFPQDYAADPLGIISPDLAAFEPTAGVVAGLAVGWLYARKRGLLHRRTLDAFAPALPVLYIGLGLANLASGEALGAPAHLPWSVYWEGEYRHPVFLYQIAAGMLVLAGWWALRESSNRGLAFTGAMMLLASSTLFLERFRVDSALLPGGWRAAQVLSLAVLAVGLALIQFWRPQKSG